MLALRAGPVVSLPDFGELRSLAGWELADLAKLAGILLSPPLTTGPTGEPRLYFLCVFWEWEHCSFWGWEHCPLCLQGKLFP